MTVLVVDGHNILFRSYYGIRALSTVDGFPTNALYGFIATLRKLIDDYKPDGVCVCFDMAAPTFRHEQSADYKATRKPMDDALAVQLPVIHDLLRAMNITIYELAGYEADDLMGTIARLTAEAGQECIIASGDRDVYQLIDERVRVIHISSKMGQNNSALIDLPAVEQLYGGLTPKQLIDLKALMGDSSDNIPGVAGIGEKTALALLQKAGTLDALYADLDTYADKASVKTKLADGKDSAYASRELAAICRTAPLAYEPSAIQLTAPNRTELYKLFTRLEFSAFIKKWGLSEQDADSTAESPQHYVPCPIAAVVNQNDLTSVLQNITANGRHIALLMPHHGLAAAFCDGQTVYTVRAESGIECEALWQSPIPKVVYDAKNMYKRFNAHQVTFDCLLAAHLCNPADKKMDLQRIALGYLGIELPDPLFEDEIAYGPLSADEPDEILAHWTSALYAVYEKLASGLAAQDLTATHDELELPLSRVLADMERAGIAIDRVELSRFGEFLKERIAECEKNAAQVAQTEINWQSPKQLGELLFDTLQLPTGKKTKNGYSTDNEVLEGLRDKHPLIQVIIDLRQLSKLSATYAEGLRKCIDHDGRIRTTFQMTATVTGRLSSTEPNLQNIPIRTELGSELRRMFVPGRPDWVLVDADYSQIELRVLAHIADDKAMQAAFNDGLDIHTATACSMFNCAPEVVTPLMRRQAKAINFGIVYGMGEHALATDLGISYGEAKAYRDSYFARFSGVREYQKSIVEAAKQQGYVTTILGRRRPLPELKASNHNIRSFGERAALNAPIQGSAADIIKLAMIALHKELTALNNGARLLLQVHDELLVECPASEAEHVKALVTRCMETVIKLSVPLVADVGIGQSWASAH